MTQVELVRRLKRRKLFISGYERGQRRLDVIEFLEIARALKTDPHAIIAACDDEPWLQTWTLCPLCARQGKMSKVSKVSKVSNNRPYGRHASDCYGHFRSSAVRAARSR